MQLSIIILTYNSQEEITRCLASIAQHYAPQLNSEKFEIIIADNASKDNSIKTVKSFFKETKFAHLIIQNKENLGFAKGINEAVKKAKGKYVVFLNPDTKLLNQGFEDALEYFKTNAKTGIIGGKLQNTQGDIEKSTGTDFGVWHILLLTFGLDSIFGQRKAPGSTVSVDWVSGGCMIVPTQLFLDMDGFDERYFMYVEDADLCRRSRAIDMKVVYLTQLEVEHVSHASGNREFAIVNIFKGLSIYAQKFNDPKTSNLIQFLLRAKARILIAFSYCLGNKTMRNTYRNALKAV